MTRDKFHGWLRYWVELRIADVDGDKDRLDISQRVDGDYGTAKGMLQAPLRLLFKKFVQSEYSKGSEFEADDFAVRLTHYAQFSSNGPFALFERLSDETDLLNNNDRFKLFNTHPAANERIANMKRTQSQLDQKTK